MSTTQTKKLSEATVVQSVADADKIPIVNSSGQTVLVPLSGLLGAVKVGGRNLLKNSGQSVSSKYDKVATYAFGDDKPSAGEQLIVSVWGEMASDVDSLAMIVSSSSGDNTAINIRRSMKNGDRYVFPLTLKGKASEVTIWQGPGIHNATTIDRIKVERGNIPTDWSPAPEDWGGE